ncbi:MAG: hypothetical protein DCF16_03440 [Alphaproteobacteria bacterium]|nr:MAG: hypothetical protein DCF16_03440 [Alphaproteobacteria bacterium]
MQTNPSTLEITYRRSIWRLTLDGAFYGDYRSRRHATDSADAAARGLRAEGRVVTIVTPAPVQ